MSNKQETKRYISCSLSLSLLLIFIDFKPELKTNRGNQAKETNKNDIQTISSIFLIFVSYLFLSFFLLLQTKRRRN